MEWVEVRLYVEEQGQDVRLHDKKWHVDEVQG